MKEVTPRRAKELLKAVGAPKGKYILDQVIDGIKVEKEHNNPGKSYKDLAKNEADQLRIALAHLDEIPDYYELLEDMEEKAKKRTKAQARAALRKANDTKET